MKLETFILERSEWVPNNQHLPVLLYRGAQAAAGEHLASAFEKLFESNSWPPQWRNGVYSYHHYHSTAHEVLGFARGWADLVIGGPGGRDIRVEAGDAVLLPAGTGHFQRQASRDFLVVGAYPPWHEFDVCRAAPTDVMLNQIATLGFPASDPVLGSAGPLPRLWQQTGSG